jgi:hypothetical protein
MPRVSRPSWSQCAPAGSWLIDCWQTGRVSDAEWDQWAMNARRMYKSLLKADFSEPQALIMVGQMLGSLVAAPA